MKQNPYKMDFESFLNISKPVSGFKFKFGTFTYFDKKDHYSVFDGLFGGTELVLSTWS